ncbi:hypothetical protein Tco_0555297, partial [Tanacetum coccineum]
MLPSCAADTPVYTAAVFATSSPGESPQPETSEESTDSFYETSVLNSEDAK